LKPVSFSRATAVPAGPGEIDSAFSTYDSLESLVSNDVILVPLGEEISLARRLQRGV